MKKNLLSVLSAFLIFTLSAQVSENFSDYTVAGKLAQQAQAMGRDYWTTWSSAPGGTEDGVIEEMSGNKVLKLAAVSSSTSNDQILRLGTKNGSVWEPRTSGAWELTFKIFIPATKDGYFNIKSVFPSTVSETWATQIYFGTDQPEVSGGIGPYNPGVGIIYAASSTGVNFNFSHDTWIPVKLFIDLDNDAAEFYVNDLLIHTWQYSKGSFGQSNHKTIAAMNIFPPSQSARSTYYVDDIVFAPVTDVIFETNFDELAADSYVAQSYPAWWRTWEDKPGTGQDAKIVTEQSQSAPNSAKLVYAGNNGTDLVFLAGDQTSGTFQIDFDMYIPGTVPAYFNLLQLFDPSGDGQNSIWAVGAYFNIVNPGTSFPAAGTYVHQNGIVTNFTTPSSNTWFPCSMFVDLDNDIANISINGTQILEWPYSVKDESGDEGLRQLAAVDFYPPQTGSIFYIDNFKFVGSGGENYPIIDVTPTEITQALPAGGTYTVPVTVSNTGTSIGDYHSWIEFDVDEPEGNYQFNVGYCSNNINVIGGFGFQTPGYSELGVKLSGTALCDKVGSYITKMSYYLSGEVENNTLVYRIYEGGTSLSSSGAVLLEYTQTNAVQGWNQVTLPSPLLIDKTDLWLAVAFVQDQEHVYPMSHDDKTQVPGVSWFKRNSESSNWTKFWEDDGQSPPKPCGNVMIKAYAEGGVVPACWLSLSGENSASLPKGTSKTFNVNFDATGLESGKVYTANLLVATNDQDNPLFTIPCTLLMGELPLITITPTSIEKSLAEDAEEKIFTELLTVTNSGEAEGTYAATVSTVSWLTLEGDVTGTVPAGENKTFDAVIDATELAIGNYETKISVTTNDFTHALIEIPCKLTIKVGVEVYLNGVETKVYPNPATDKITVESNITMTSVQIINHIGQVVSTTIVNGELTTVNTSNLSTGYYFVKVNTDKGSRSIKFVVK